jgi:hypothetical protein
MDMSIGERVLKEKFASTRLYPIIMEVDDVALSWYIGEFMNNDRVWTDAECWWIE